MSQTHKNEYGRMLCMFLAEGIRTRKIPLKRSVEIAEEVLKHVNLLDTEYDFLSLVKEMAKDFDELVVLEDKMKKNHDNQMKRDLEIIIKDYVVRILPTDSQKALAVLQDAASGQFTLAQMQGKYPDLKP